MCCAPSVGEGRNNLLNRNRCANPLCKAGQDRFGDSVGARRGILPDDVRIEIAEKFCEMAGDATDRWKLAQRRHGF